MATKSFKSVQGVPYEIRNGEYYFSLPSVARKLGFKSIATARDLCRTKDLAKKLANGDQAISFDDLLLIAKGAPKIPADFIDELKEEIERNRNKAESTIAKGTPDFRNPAESARAWAQLYEQNEKLKKQLVEARESLGDGEDFKIVRAIPWLNDYFGPYQYLPQVLGTHLSNMTKKANAPVRRCQAFGYQKASIGMYSVQIIQQLKDKLDADETFMAHWRAGTAISKGINGRR